MKKYSKCAIYSLTKLTNKDGKQFYDASLIENAYNPKIPYANKWEAIFYKCQIYTDLELETADFSLEVDKNKYSFVNISNPEKSIIRVLDFEVVKKSCWKGNQQLKSENKKPQMKEYIAIHSCEYDKQNYKTEERKISDYVKKLEYQKQQNSKLRKEVRQLKESIIERDNELLKKNKQINNVEITYNPKYKPEKSLPTEDDMIEFEDI